MDYGRALREVVALRSPGGAAVVAVVLGVVLDALSPLDLLASGLLAVAAVGVAYAARNPAWAGTVVRRTGAGPVAWGAAGLLFVGGVAVTYAVGDPRPFCEGWSYRGCVAPYGWALAGYAGGCLALALAAGNWRRYRRVTAPVTGAGEVEPGRAAVVGRVVPVGSGLATREDDAVAYRRAVREPRGGVPGRGVLDGGYRTVERDGDAVPFYVEDGSGRLLVVPERVDEHAVAEWWPTRDEAAATTAGTATIDDGDRRVRERVLARDDAVFVAGTASDVDRAEYPAGVAVGVEGPVTVAATDRDHVVGAVRWRVWSAAVLAAVLGGGGLVAMLLTA